MNQRFETRVDSISSDRFSLNLALTWRCEEGWEPLAAIPVYGMYGGVSRLQLVFKRPRQ